MGSVRRRKQGQSPGLPVGERQAVGGPGPRSGGVPWPGPPHGARGRTWNLGLDPTEPRASHIRLTWAEI